MRLRLRVWCALCVVCLSCGLAHSVYVVFLCVVWFGLCGAGETLCHMCRTAGVQYLVVGLFGCKNDDECLDKILGNCSKRALSPSSLARRAWPAWPR